MALALNNENFDQAISTGVALVDFWATWCGPCRMMGPVVESLAQEYAGRVTVGKVDVDQAQDLAVRFGVMSIPAIFVFKNGEVVRQFVGVTDREALVAAIREAEGVA